MKTLPYLLLLSLCFACSTKPKEETAQAVVDHYAALPANFAEVLKAHGGLEKWRSFKALEYDLTNLQNPAKSEHYTLDLLNRKDLTQADSFKIGFDGQQVWVAPRLKAFKGPSARFYHNLFSYFFTVPFILADPGAQYSNDTLTVDGKLYDVIDVSFQAGIGDADKDTYRLLIDPASKKLEKLLYTVTYFSGEANQNYNGLSYSDFTNVNGLLLPTRLTGYKYEAGKLTEKRYEVTFANIQLKTESPDQALFAMPAESEIDTLKAH